MSTTPIWWCSTPVTFVRRRRRRSIRRWDAASSEGRSGACRVCTSPSPSRAASPRPRAPRLCGGDGRSIWWSGRRAYHRLPALLEQSARGGWAGGSRISGGRQIHVAEEVQLAEAKRARRRHRFPLPSRKVATSSAPSAWCPTRAAQRHTRPARQIVDEARMLADRGRSRDHAARPDRQRLSRRRHGWPHSHPRAIVRAPRRHSRHRPASLHNEPSRATLTTV